MNIILRCYNASPQDVSGNFILPHESRTFDDVAVHTVISNQYGFVTDVLRQGVFISPKLAWQQQQQQQQQQRQNYYHHQEE